jgi:ribosomal protein S18 acetylase RimI-like enzyme
LLSLGIWVISDNLNFVLEIRQLTAAEGRQHLSALAAVLLDCVEGGASVGFMAGFSQSDAECFFERVIQEVEQGNRILFAAFLESQLVGTVQVITAMPPNQPHRAEIAKLLVSRSARGLSVGRQLMEQAEEASRIAGKTLLVLDTASGAAEKIYTNLGWTRLGVIPNYALLPDGRFCDTTIFFKQLLVG